MMASDAARAKTSVPSLAIAALSLAAFGSAASMRVTDPLLPRIETEFGVGLATAAYVVIAFSLAYGILQALFGAVGDRYGKYRVVAAACAGSAVTALACALAPGFPSLVTARMLAGAAAAAIIPLSMAWIGDVVPYEQRQAVLARFLTGQMLGIASGQLIGGFAAEHLSWRAPFFALAVWFAVSAIVLVRMNRRSAGPRGSAAAQSARRRPIADLLSVFTIPWARVIIATVFLEGVLLFGPLAFIATHLHRSQGLSLSAAGSALMLFGAGGLAFAGLVSLLLRHLGETGLAAGGGMILFAALLAIGLGPDWRFAIPGCALLGLGFYMLHNTLQTNATQMSPSNRGAAIAVFATAFFLGQSLGVTLAGLAVERFSTAPVMAFGGAGLCALGYAFSRRKAAQLARR
jgi:predicted MFS family arabinose efflux permease